jgi:hypothetical protein
VTEIFNVGTERPFSAIVTKGNVLTEVARLQKTELAVRKGQHTSGAENRKKDGQ